MSQDQRPKTNGPRPTSQDQWPKTNVPRLMSQDQRPKTNVPRPMAQDQSPKTNVPRLTSQDQWPKTVSYQDCSGPRLPQGCTVPRLCCPKTVPRLQCPKTSLVLSQDSSLNVWISDLFLLRFRDFLIYCTLYHHSSSSENFTKKPSLNGQMLTPPFLITSFSMFQVT